MKCAVIKIVIYLIIINGICLVAGEIGYQLAITDEPSAKIQSCIGKVIEHILKPTESLAIVISSQPDYIPSRLPNPVTVLDVREPLPTHYKRYEVNYVIEAENQVLFMEAMYTILWSQSLLWHWKESPKGKFIIFIKEEESLQDIFFMMWRHIWALHIVVVIDDDTSKNCPMKFITSNPQAEGNDCSRKPTVFSNFSCDNISSLEFLKPIRNYNGCPVLIQLLKPLWRIDWNKKRDRIVYNLLAGLNRTLNVTPILRESFDLVLYRHNAIVLDEYFFGKTKMVSDRVKTISIIFSRRVYLWMGPRPTRISPLNTVFLPFTYDLWIGVLIITILVILIKWMIIKGNGYNNNCVNLACAFTDIIGLTFGVCVNRIPNIWSLKLLLAFFLIYVIHIHTAYTSDLINIFTVPRYEGLISNVEEVAASGIPIHMHAGLAKVYFGGINDGDNLAEKVNKLIISTSVYELESIQSMLSSKNAVAKKFTVDDEDNTKIPNSVSTFNNKYLRKRKVNVFLTNDLSGEIKTVLTLKNSAYFVESLNAVITHLWESGTYDMDANLNPSPYQTRIDKKEPESKTASALDAFFSQDEAVRPLHMTDLLPIFVILLICYSFCIIVFVSEIFVHKIVTRHSNRVVPLNV